MLSPYRVAYNLYHQNNPHSPSQATRFCEGYLSFFVENTDGNFFPLLSFALCHVGENILLPDRILVRWRIADFARNDAVLQHPRRLAFADVEHFVKQFQGDDLAVFHG